MLDVGPLVGIARTLARASTYSGTASDVHRHIHLFDALITHDNLVAASRQLFVDGHYARAVEEAFKALAGRIRERTGLKADGRSLMETAFSLKRPRLRLSDLANQSQRDEQIGHKDLFVGCVTGLRNPRAHDHRYSDSPERALRLLVFADYLFCVVDSAETNPEKKADME